MAISVTSAYTANSNLNSLISQYMAIQSRPLTNLQTQKTNLSNSLNIYADLKSKLSDLSSLATDLSNTTTSSVYNTRTASSSDETKLTASAGTGATTGAFQIRVKQLATGATIQSTAQLITKPATVSGSKVAPGSGTIDVTKSFSTAGFSNLDVTGTVTIGAWTSAALSTYTSVQQFMDAVNAAGVNANIYYDKTVDAFYLESKTATPLTFSESTAPGGATTGFFTAVKMRSTTGPGYAYRGTTDATGIQSGVILDKANFDIALTSTTTGNFNINGVAIAYNTTTDTLDTVLSRINNSTANVTAFYDRSLNKVVIKSKGSGSTDTVTLSDVTGNLMSALKVSAATATSGQNALFTINSTNAADEISKNSNTFTVNNTTYTLKSTNVTAYTDNTATTVTVKQDTSAVQSKITTFLSKFNEVVQYIKDKSGLDPLTKTRGALANNTTFASLKGNLFKTLLGQVTGLTAGNPDYLNKIGITFDSNLKASLSDTTKFNNAITANPQSVQDLFNSANGVATKLVTLVNPFINSTATNRSSIIDGATNTISKRITGLDASISRMQTRLQLQQNQYSQQLYKMQNLLNNVVAQGSQISSLINTAFGSQ